MTLPNFLVIGTAKAGTTSLYHCLNAHPQVYMSPVKEPNHFAGADGHRDFPKSPFGEHPWTDYDAYLVLFDGVSDEIAIGEASTAYLYNHNAPERIKRLIPEARFVAILRQPADRAYSMYLQARRDLLEDNRDFAKALEQEDARIRDRYEFVLHYRRPGFYHEQLCRWFRHFPRERFLVFLYEDWDDSSRMLRETYRFLGVDDGFVPASITRHNAACVPRHHDLQLFFSRRNPLRDTIKAMLPGRVWQGAADLARNIRQKNLTEPPPLDPELRRQLTEGYRDDILRLQDLIARDLSGWLY